jgi:hypothetical protein
MSIVDTILKDETKENIRSDFLVFYSASIALEDSPVRRVFLSRSRRYYINQLIWWQEKAKKFDPHEKIIKKIDKQHENADAVSDVLTFFDAIRTLLTLAFPFLSAISLFSGASAILTTVLLIISAPLVLIGWYIEILKIDTKAIQKINENLVYSHDDVLLPDGQISEIEKIICQYIWNKSLCNTATLPNFLLLLNLKKFVPMIYDKIKNSMVEFLPAYMPYFVKNRGRLNLVIFLLKNRKFIKK